MNIILGEVCACGHNYIFGKTKTILSNCVPFNGVSQASSRDTRLLAGTAVAMLLTTPSDSQCAESAAWSLLQINNTGKLQHLIALYYLLQKDC